MADTPGATGTARVGRLSLLEGESIRAKLEVGKMSLTLTDRRVLATGEERRLWFFDGPRATRAAFLDDLTLVSAASKYLPDWLAIGGAAFVLFALFGGIRDNAFALVLGAVMIGAWYLVKTDVLEVKVGSETFAVLPVRAGHSSIETDIDRFVDNVFRAKWARLPGGR